MMNWKTGVTESSGVPLQYLQRSVLNNLCYMVLEDNITSFSQVSPGVQVMECNCYKIFKFQYSFPSSCWALNKADRAWLFEELAGIFPLSRFISISEHRGGLCSFFICCSSFIQRGSLLEETKVTFLSFILWDPLLCPLQLSALRPRHSHVSRSLLLSARYLLQN